MIGARRTFAEAMHREHLALMLRHGAEVAVAQQRVAQALARLTELIGPPVYPDEAAAVELLLREIDGRWCDISDRLHDCSRRLSGDAST